MSAFPATRLRRLRRTDALRSLVRETQLSLEDVVAPLFACPGEGVARPIEGLPGIGFSPPAWLWFGIRLGLTLGIADLSYRFVENRYRHFR